MLQNGYLEVNILAMSETEEGLCDFLFSEGALGLVTEDLAGEPRRIRIQASFPGGSPIEGIVKRLRRYQDSLAALGFSGADGRIEVREVPVEDWGNNWKEHFKPLLVGRRLVIAPSWNEEPLPEGRLLIRIDPGLAFGTGHHVTTRMCLEVLEELLGQWQESCRPVVLDVGMGTGILAIAAASLGAQRVVTIDTDPVACESARENLALNQCADRVEILCGGLEVLDPDLRFDLILANLDTWGLSTLLENLARLLTKGGQMIASGILVEDEESVIRFVRASRLRVTARRIKEGWLCLTLAAEGS